MKLTNLNNSPYFTSIYKFNIEHSNYKHAHEAVRKIVNLEPSNDNVQVFSEFPTFDEACKTEIYEKISASVDDRFDDLVKSILKQRNIQYTKQTKKEVLEPENIYNRIVMPEDTSCTELVALDTKKIDDLFKENYCYVSENLTTSRVDNRFQCFRDFLATGRNIEASQIVLREEAQHPVLDFIDGRHRFCVMRDMGLDKIKFAMSKDSLKLAYKYNLIAE